MVKGSNHFGAYLLSSASSVVYGREVQSSLVHELHLRDDASEIQVRHCLHAVLTWSSCMVCEVRLSFINVSVGFGERSDDEACICSPVYVRNLSTNLPTATFCVLQSSRESATSRTSVINGTEVVKLLLRASKAMLQF